MDLRDLLQEVKNSNIDIEEALGKLKNLPYEDLGYANIDHHRELRNGYPEVIYCEGKTDEHILGIIDKMNEKGSNILGTRCRKETFNKVKEVYKNAEYEELSKILKIQNHDIVNIGKGKILILTGGTSDIPVADEAYYTAKFLGNDVEKIYDVGVAGLDPKLIYLIGRLRYRTSFGQNVLIHSMEVAHLSGSLAEELGADVAVAKKAGLLHDIGKAVDHEIQGTHVKIGMKILEKFNIDEEVIDAMKSHHEEYPFGTAESFIVAAADAISAGRPGARKDTLEQYLKRIGELEDIVNSFDTVEKSYAIQAGREIRVFVDSEKLDDYGSVKLARDIADKIEEELKYPGEVKVNVLRETRSIEFAR